MDLKQTIEAIGSEVIRMRDTQGAEIAEMKTALEALDKYVARIGAPPGGGSSTGDFSDQYAKDFHGSLKAGRPVGTASTLDDPSGGYTAPAEMDRTITTLARSVNAMRQLADIRTLDRDLELVVSTSGIECGFVTEKEARDETDGVNLSKILLSFKEMYAMPVATNKLLDLSFVNFLGWLSSEAGYAFAAKEEWAFINSDGVSAPRGIMNYPTVANASWEWGKLGYVKSGHASQITADGLFDIQDALAPQYRANASWLMAGSTWTAIRKMKTGESEYIWRPGLEDGAPATLLGRPVYISEQMPAVEADAFPVVYGDFKRSYMIGDHSKGSVVLPDPYTSKGFTKVYIVKRILGGLVNFEGLKLLKVEA